MNKNSRAVALAVIAATLILAMAYFLWDSRLRGGVVHCPDGSSHPKIDIRDFTTRYWAYSAKLEVSIDNKTKMSTQLDPKTLDQASQALQSTREFRKYVVAGYDSCAITPERYERLGARFQALDSLAQQIDSLISQQSLSLDEKEKNANLIKQYGDLARQLGSE
jgi:hypothetical protein